MNIQNTLRVVRSPVVDKIVPLVGEYSVCTIEQSIGGLHGDGALYNENSHLSHKFVWPDTCGHSGMIDEIKVDAFYFDKLMVHFQHCHLFLAN